MALIINFANLDHITDIIYGDNYTINIYFTALLFQIVLFHFYPSNILHVDLNMFVLSSPIDAVFTFSNS